MATSQILINALKDPTYKPYCMRCSRLIRMQIVGDLKWRCHCGAEHVEERPISTLITTQED